ncbi:hypothetical protein ACIRJO_26895 [Streptomyces sp. NPDC102394]|uniref:hypothetical protein n=1 Tax=Streptomyces sp. NPDC102394 TaxID=3366167 RepID=UPI0037FE59E5
MTWLSRVFELNPGGLNWPRAVAFLDAAPVLMFVFWAIGNEVYLPSALFGLLFAALADPGGSYGHRVLSIALFPLIGAGVTALALGVGSGAWGWLVLVAFVVTLAAGLAAAFAVRRFVNALLLNIWFIVAVGFEVGIHDQGHITNYVWAQVLSWTGRAALWITVTFLWCLIRGRADRGQPFSGHPGGTSRWKLTRPLVLFTVIRAVVIAGTVALAFGLGLSYGSCSSCGGSPWTTSPAATWTCWALPERRHGLVVRTRLCPGLPCMAFSSLRTRDSGIRSAGAPGRVAAWGPDVFQATLNRAVLSMTEWEGHPLPASIE